MNLIVPMAGMGKRLRPHTLTIPKPLMPIAGKPIVQRLVEDIVKVCENPVENIGFVIARHFGEKIEQNLLEIARNCGAQGRIFYQDEALGTGHAIYCAKDILKGESIVAFADTLFKAEFKLDTDKDAIIWTQKVQDPSAFGVVQVDQENKITAFIEKPQTFVSDLAIIGIYYFREGNILKEEIQYIIDNKLMDSNEYQLTRVLENMQKKRGVRFYPVEVEEWLDCGNKTATVNTNQRYLEYIKNENLVDESTKLINSVVIPPSYIGENVTLINSIVGPYVSIGDNTKVANSRIENSIIQNNSKIEHANFSESMLGNEVTYRGSSKKLSIGDHNNIEA